MKIDTIPPVLQSFPSTKSITAEGSTGIKLFGSDAVTFDTEHEQAGQEENPYQEFFRKKRKKKDLDEEKSSKDGPENE